MIDWHMGRMINGVFLEKIGFIFIIFYKKKEKKNFQGLQKGTGTTGNMTLHRYMRMLDIRGVE
jgi:hypothetical protein